MERDARTTRPEVPTLSSERLSLNIISTHSLTTRHAPPLSLRDDRPKHSAASSHRANDEYMARMEDGMRSMGITSGGNDDDDGDAHHSHRVKVKSHVFFISPREPSRRARGLAR